MRTVRYPILIRVFAMYGIKVISTHRVKAASHASRFGIDKVCEVGFGNNDR